MAGPQPRAFDKDFGFAVQRARTERQLSREELAQQLEAEGIGLKALREIESGRRPARLSEASAIANTLGAPLETMLGLGLDGLSERDLRRKLAKLEREHAGWTKQIAETQAVIDRVQEEQGLRERAIQSDRAIRAVVHNEWLKVRIVMEKRGLDVEHQEA